jgi:replication-associated recombination protein RarA
MTLDEEVNLLKKKCELLEKQIELEKKHLELLIEIDKFTKKQQDFYPTYPVYPSYPYTDPWIKYKYL